MSSAKRVTRARPGRKPAQSRHNHSGAVDMTAPIRDRYRLLRLKQMVSELREHGRSCRWIASHTWRGVGAHGYFQRIDAGDHLKKVPGIRPREQDFYDLNIIWRTTRDFAEAEAELFNLVMNVVRDRAALDGSIAAMISGVRPK